MKPGFHLRVGAQNIVQATVPRLKGDKKHQPWLMKEYFKEQIKLVIWLDAGCHRFKPSFMELKTFLQKYLNKTVLAPKENITPKGQKDRQIPDCATFSSFPCFNRFCCRNNHKVRHSLSPHQNMDNKNRT